MIKEEPPYPRCENALFALDPALSTQPGRVQQLTGRIGRTIDRQAIHYVVYRLSTIAAILFYWIRMKVVQQLTCLTQVVPMVRPIRPVSC